MNTTLTETDTLARVREASRSLALLDKATINQVLLDLADKAIEESEFILQENKKDLERMDPADPRYDRLELTKGRLDGIASDLKQVAELESPLDHELMHKVLDNGLEIQKVTVPLGVVGIIYEARPNVTFDVFSLCLKSGNACVLKGGSDAIYSNTAIIKLIHKVLEENNVDINVVNLLPAGREAAETLLKANGYVDLIIPRGSQSLINYVRDNASVPVIETGAGIVHNFFDKSGDLKKGKEIIFNAKTRRPSVCNALDCLLIHEERLEDLPELTAYLANKNVEIFADRRSYEVFKTSYPSNLLHQATEEHYGTEFLSLRMSVKTVSGLKEALEQINQYSSQHSEAIISEDDKNIDRYMRAVDAAAVYANSSTAFTDGAQFGLGAEIGISTQKLHARGPMALEELTSYKWLIKGDGQTRP